MSSWSELSSVVKLWSPFGSVLLILEAKDAKKLLNSKTNISKGKDYNWVRPWLGEGLLLSTGEKWENRRKMLNPTFHFKILEDFMHVFNKESQKMVDILRKESQSGNTVDIHNFVTRCALDIICVTAMGTSSNAQDFPDGDYTKAINDYRRLTKDRSLRPWLRFETTWKLSSLYQRQQESLKMLHGFTTQVIAKRKATFLREKEQAAREDQFGEENDTEMIYFKSKKRLAFLDLLLQVQVEKGEKELSDVDIRQETDTFMLGEHDTTSSSSSFTLFVLGSYPQFQEKVHEELDSIFGNDKHRPVTSEDLNRMKYLEMVIKESLRLYPPVPFIQRTLSTDIPLDDGRILPKGATVGIFIYKIHKDADVFKNPEEFRPERFLPGLESYDALEYIPFSAGQRNCIGQKFAMMEEKVILSTVLRNFKVKVMMPLEDLKLLSEITLRSDNGLPVQLMER
ncbi:cytochrome P450 4C1 [Folsomia candida]|uniref:cytochrome P450 4C1 n=1 Tax=Folsomia candida TaxID=158441 RepID=UPI000B8F4E86|nr:cytochrome P450 4C1 [Folsomia candida]